MIIIKYKPLNLKKYNITNIKKTTKAYKWPYIAQNFSSRLTN